MSIYNDDFDAIDHFQTYDDLALMENPILPRGITTAHFHSAATHTPLPENTPKIDKNPKVEPEIKIPLPSYKELDAALAEEAQQLTRTGIDAEQLDNSLRVFKSEFDPTKQANNPFTQAFYDMGFDEVDIEVSLASKHIDNSFYAWKTGDQFTPLYEGYRGSGDKAIYAFPEGGGVGWAMGATILLDKSGELQVPLEHQKNSGTPVIFGEDPDNAGTYGYFNREGVAYNEKNPGAFIVAKKQWWQSEDKQFSANVGFKAGGYINSYHKETFVAGVVAEGCANLADSFNVCAGVETGLIKGYKGRLLGGQAYISAEMTKGPLEGAYIKAGFIPQAEQKQSPFDFNETGSRAITLSVGMDTNFFGR